MGSPGIEFVRRGVRQRDRGLKGREGRKLGSFTWWKIKGKRMPKYNLHLTKSCQASTLLVISVCIAKQSTKGLL